ncbi:fibropellin-3-like [Branchiostoma lanceolatum]|uniref:fibropellin-3-like n=1 Tax=Branchiostoma lanceolatum TaxID=7740 RepID=UPI003455EDF0
MWKLLLFVAAVVVWAESARGENVAQGKPAYQSSTHPDPNIGPASAAVDGNTNTDFSAGSCASTLDQSNPSWWVDLGQEHIIDRVDIFNRQDCCGEQLDHFDIHIGDSPQVGQNLKCGDDHRIDPNQPAISVSCYGMRGRYVGIRLPGPFRRLTLCEVLVSGETDDCASSPCVHGTCSDIIGGYSCYCEPGWTGHNCDTGINECESSPCVHGTCIDGPASYTCRCANGWAGTNCEQDIDDCATNPCIHGTCTDGVASYTCSCELGWEGTNCDQDVDWCNPDPCHHNWICEDLGVDYHCHPPHRARGFPYKCSSDSCLDGMYCTPESGGAYSCKHE